MNPDLTPRQLLDAFVLEQIAEQPLAQRILLYRAFAAECNNAALKSNARALAQECEAVVRHHQQFVLNFQQALN